MRVPALNVLVATAWELRRYRTAADTIVQLRGEIRDTAQRAGFAVLLAEAYFRAGDFLAAAAAYEQAIDERPASITRGLLMFQQGLSLIRAGDLDGAQRILDARADDPDLDVVNRWQSEWNLAKAMQVAGRTVNAYARLNRLLTAGETPAGLPADLVLKLLETLGLLGLHPAVLRSPTIIGRLADLQGLQHRRLVLPSIEHRIRVPKLPHNLLRRMPLPSLRRHRQGLLALRAWDLHNRWIRKSIAGQWRRPNEAGPVFSSESGQRQEINRHRPQSNRPYPRADEKQANRQASEYQAIQALLPTGR
jgi:tetratricopeptide (TPR) repeat protein